MSSPPKDSDEVFLAEQVSRIRLMTEQLSQVQKGVSANSEAVLRKRVTACRGPLDVRDCRPLVAAKITTTALRRQRRARGASHQRKRQR